jgi:hypothetical protein
MSDKPEFDFDQAADRLHRELWDTPGDAAQIARIAIDLRAAFAAGVESISQKKKLPSQRTQPTLAEKFWAKVQKTEGCWDWLGSRRNRYGQSAPIYDG